MFSQEVALSVNCPEVVKRDAAFISDVYFKNQTTQKVQVPKYIFGGPGRFFYHKLYDLNGKEIKILSVPEYALSPGALSSDWLELNPGGIIGAYDKLRADKIFPGPGKYRIQFVWEGMLVASDGNKITKKYVIDKWVTVE